MTFADRIRTTTGLRNRMTGTPLAFTRFDDEVVEQWPACTATPTTIAEYYGHREYFVCDAHRGKLTKRLDETWEFWPSWGWGRTQQIPDSARCGQMSDELPSVDI